MELSEVRILICIGRRQHVYVFLFVCKLVELVGGASVINRATLSRLNIKKVTHENHLWIGETSYLVHHYIMFVFFCWVSLFKLLTQISLGFPIFSLSSPRSV